MARVANLAEAGFLADELVGSGIEARVHQADEFSAASGQRGTHYMIRVPSVVAREAASLIRRHLVDEAAECEDASQFRRFGEDASIDPLFWRPVAVVILAGVASFVLGQRFSDQHDHKDERRPARDSLSSAVDAIGRPLVTEPMPGQPRFRLSFDRQRDRWLLEIDLNGDGRYDRRRDFHASGAAR